MTPFPCCHGKGMRSTLQCLFGSHKPTTVSGFPPETVLQPRTGLRHTHRSIQRPKYSVFFGKENQIAASTTNTSKEVVIKQRSHAKLFAIFFFGCRSGMHISFRQRL